MVKFVLPRGALKRVKLKGYRRGNHAWSAGAARRGHYAPTSKILIEFDIVEFDENSRRFCPKTSLQCERQLQPCLVRFGLKAAEKSSGIMGRVMFFLLRMAFWLGVVCVLLPSGAKPTSAWLAARSLLRSATRPKPARARSMNSSPPNSTRSPPRPKRPRPKKPLLRAKAR